MVIKKQIYFFDIIKLLTEEKNGKRIFRHFKNHKNKGGNTLKFLKFDNIGLNYEILGVVF